MSEMTRPGASCQLCGRRLAPGEIRYRLVSPEVLALGRATGDVFLRITEEPTGLCCHRCRKQHMELLAERPETGERLYGCPEKELYVVEGRTR